MSSESELTSDYDDEEDVPLSRSQRGKSKAKGKDDDDSGYRIRGALKVPRATTYTCQSLYEQIAAQDIDLQAEYQRDVVWPDTKQMRLIDSIFRNYYVPPVIFVVHVSDDGAERRVCVDGKQRMTSIYRFIAGEIPFKDPYTKEKFVFKDVGKHKSAQILPERYQKIFMNKQMVCMEYQDITPENERDIFQRVQLGMALTPAEKLQAISGPHKDFIREILDAHVVDKLATLIAWEVSRGNDFRSVAVTVYSMSRWPVKTLPTNATIESWLQEPESDLDDAFREDVHNTYQIFIALSKDPKLKEPFWISGIKKVAPVEMAAICILIHVNKTRMTLAQLSEAIGMMRNDIRQTEKDIRQNNRNFKSVLTFLAKLKKSDLRPDKGELAVTALQTAGKRKRVARADSDEEAPPHPTLRTPAVAPAAASSFAPNAHSSKASASPRVPPTVPSAVRSAGTSLASRSSVPTPPPPPTSRQISLGDSLMARMASTSGPSQNGNQAYDQTRDPRRVYKS